MYSSLGKFKHKYLSLKKRHNGGDRFLQVWLYRFKNMELCTALYSTLSINVNHCMRTQRTGTRDSSCTMNIYLGSSPSAPCLVSTHAESMSKESLCNKLSIPLITRATRLNRRCLCTNMFHTTILAAKAIFAQLLLESLPEKSELICHKWRVQEWPCEKVQVVH